MRKSEIVRFIPVCAVLLALGTGVAVLTSAPAPPFGPHDKAFYASETLVNFVRPGLIITVAGVEIGTDRTVKARVKFSDPRGLPLDRDGITTPGTISCSLILARIPKGATQYVSYTTRNSVSNINGTSAIQAAADSGGTWTRVAEGDYTYTFATKLPADYDKTVTHTIGAYGSRNLTEFDMGTNYDDNVLNFVPDGTAVKDVRDVIRTATCNKCHYDQGLHGGSRKTMEICVLCHTPQTIDPDTGNTVDMAVMTHKIHMGSSLPSVIGGKPYIIIGNRDTVHDYSEIAFPPLANNCVACHETDKGATQGDNMFKANRAACGSCHDDIDFAAGKNHIAQTDDKNCIFCHPGKSQNEFDNSVQGAHVIPQFSRQLPGLVFKILEVQEGQAGKNPLVVFSATDKSGKPVDIKALSRVNMYLAGPNKDYANTGSAPSQDVRQAEGSGAGVYWARLTNAIPATAKGSWTVTIEARNDVVLNPGTARQVTARDTAPNVQFYFSVDGSPLEPRRQVVATEKCNACHYSIGMTFHGQGRNSAQECGICHTPSRAVSPEPLRSIDFAVMAHKIHRGRELVRGYAIGSASFSEIGYPGDLRVCTVCHVNGSEQLPLAEGLLPVISPFDYISPAGKTTAACLACHDSKYAAAHAATNTSPSLGEACAACHGTGAEFEVNKVHAR